MKIKKSYFFHKNVKPNHHFSVCVFLTSVLCSCSPSDNNSTPILDMAALDMHKSLDSSLNLNDLNHDTEIEQMFDMFEDLPGDHNTHEPYTPPALTAEQQESFDLILESFKTVCELAKRCFPVYFDQLHSSIDSCVRSSSDRSYLRHEMTYVSVTPAQVQTCLEQWQQADCSELHLIKDIGYKEACLFKGTKAPGERCHHHMACDSGFCDYGSRAEKSCSQVAVCVAPFEVGERDCGSPSWLNCPPRMPCRRIGNEFICHPRVLPYDPSIDCRLIGNNGAGSCDGFNYFCDQEDGLCKPYTLEGESCKDRSCFIYDQLTCPYWEEEPVCEKIPDDEWFLPAGAPCNNVGHHCIPGTICAGSQSQYCQYPLNEGDPCEYGDPCPSGTRCNTELGFCESRDFSTVCMEPQEP